MGKIFPAERSCSGLFKAKLTKKLSAHCKGRRPKGDRYIK